MSERRPRPKPQRQLVYQGTVHEREIRVVVARFPNRYDEGTTTVHSVERRGEDAMGEFLWKEILDPDPKQTIEILCAILWGKHKDGRPAVIHEWEMRPIRYRITANDTLGYRLEKQGHDYLVQSVWWPCLLQPGHPHNDGTDVYRYAAYELIRLLMEREGTKPSWWRR